MIANTTLPVELTLVIVTATVLAVVARKLKQPVLLAYLLTGLVLGPALLNIVGGTRTLTLMSELGLGFLLFLVGIEMNLDEIRDLLKPISVIAVGQTILQTGLAFVVPLALGFGFFETVIIALCTVFGATPVIVKILTEKDELKSLPGKLDVGVLVLQDIYLILIVALINSGTLTQPDQILGTLAKIVALIGVIGVISLASSRYILDDIFKQIADNRHAFFIHGVAWAFLFITLAEFMGLSVEVGAFLAGLGLGQIPYREEIKERIRPLTDFFMVIFFSTLGLTLSVENLQAYWVEAILASGVMMIGNFVIMFYLIDRMKFTPRTSFIGSINMTQVSEFSLVVGALAVQQGYIGNDVLGYISLMAVFTIGLSTYLINYNKEIYQKIEHLLEWLESEEKKDVEINQLEDHAVIVGYDEISEKICRTLEREHDILVIDQNPDNTEVLSRSPYEYIYGDFKHGEIREGANLEGAEFIISFSDEKDVNLKVLEEQTDNAIKIVTAKRLEEASEMYDLGADYVIMENILAGNRIGEYLELYLEDRELFREEVKSEIKHIKGEERSQN
ncbi:cation:proton antiporter [Candidatus Nanosalina sp. VS9-1]|uniref:cation:proton antiporter domain-containing protein n=1 Tax=Candidatus Nanosalina sp. VS9-1 TaxID=3388566 RepID=UPI0039E16339